MLDKEDPDVTEGVLQAVEYIMPICEGPTEGCVVSKAVTDKRKRAMDLHVSCRNLVVEAYQDAHWFAFQPGLFGMQTMAMILDRATKKL